MPQMQEKEPTRYEARDDSGSAAGIDCRWYDAFEGAKKVREVCLAPKGAMGLHLLALGLRHLRHPLFELRHHLLLPLRDLIHHLPRRFRVEGHVGLLVVLDRVERVVALVEQKDGVSRLRLLHPNLPCGDHDGLRLGGLAGFGVLDFQFGVGKRRHRDAEAQRGGAATKLEDGSAASGQRSAFSGQLRIRASG